MTKNIQLPLIQDPVGKLITLKLYDITPVGDLDCQEPDSELIAVIAQSWVPPIIVCPDNRFTDENNHSLYYPIDGKRRIKAVSYLDGLGYEFQGVPVANMPIQAILREDLLPQDEASYRLAFQANNLRSSNPSTDVNAIKSTAKSLGVDVFTKEGRSAVAKELHVSPQAIGKLAKGLLVDESIWTAYTSGQIADETLTAILHLRDLQARDAIVKRLVAGEKLSKKDITVYNKQLKQAELVHANETKPTIESHVTGGNPLLEAIDILEIAINAEFLDEDDIEKAIVLLKTLL